MKKTFNINLGGTVFNIDEDAYQLLDKYLNNLRIHFRKEEGSDEIMEDFENRISELFSERIRLGYQVITLKEVEMVITRMGKPEELFEDDSETEQEKPTEIASEVKGGRKRLMRDPDNKIIGGVAGGLAAYMGWDATLVRIAMLLLLFFFGIVSLIYLLLWIILPEAKTATEKLEMRGESVTVETIGKTVTDSFDNIGNRINELTNSEGERSVWQKAADLIVQIVGVLVKVALVLAGIVLFPILAIVLLVVAVALLAIIIGGTSFLYEISPFGLDFVNNLPTFLVVLGFIGFFLFLGIPVFYIGYALTSTFFKTKPLTSSVKWTLAVLWLISTLLVGYYTLHMGIEGFFHNVVGPYWAS